MKLQLYSEGFRYRFVTKNFVDGRNRRVHPEVLDKKEGEEEESTARHPPIVLRSRCGCCGAGGVMDMSPADRLAAAIDQAFRDVDGTSKSQVFEVADAVVLAGEEAT